MKIARYCITVLGVATLFWLLPFGASSQEQLDPLVVASDTHKLLFENQFVRVIEAKVPPGKMEPKHKHPHGVTVYLATYDIENKTYPDAKVTKVTRTLGTVSWSEPTVHEVKNVGKTAMDSIRIELKY